MIVSRCCRSAAARKALFVTPNVSNRTAERSFQVVYECAEYLIGLRVGYGPGERKCAEKLPRHGREPSDVSIKIVSTSTPSGNVHFSHIWSVYLKLSSKRTNLQMFHRRFTSPPSRSDGPSMTVPCPTTQGAFFVRLADCILSRQILEPTDQLVMEDYRFPSHFPENQPPFPVFHIRLRS